MDPSHLHHVKHQLCFRYSGVFLFHEEQDGKEFVKERVELAKSKGKFWQDYKFTDPLTKTVQPKQMYCEKYNEVVVCGGIYK